jgi:hypothetical protein
MPKEVFFVPLSYILASFMKSIPKKEASALMLPKVCVWMVASLVMFMLTACHGRKPDSAPTGSGEGSGAGILSVTLTDTQIAELEAINVVDTTEHAVVRGRITDGNNGLAGVHVSAQKSDPGTARKDQVVVQSMTTTDGNGNYAMYLEPDIYYIVAYKGGVLYGLSYMGCARIVAEPNTSYTQNLELSSAMTGNITGIVTVDSCDADQHVNISVRKIPLCPGSSGNEQIEVTSLSVAGGVFYTVSLPGRVSEPETYTVIASTKSDTVTAVTGVTANTETTLYTDFSS